MENLPKNVINHIMFYTSHPAADIVRESSIFKFMEQISNDERPYNHQRYSEGCPAHCGFIDACHPRERGAVWDPRKFDVSINHRVKCHRDLEEEEVAEYEVAWKHSAQSYFSRRLPDLIVYWKIKEREGLRNINEVLELESGSEYQRSDGWESAQSDTESDSESD